MSGLADELRRWSDEDLVRLLRARPDLTSPAPSSVTALAARAASRPSVERALAGLDRYHLDAAEAVVALADVAAQPMEGSADGRSAAIAVGARPAVPGQPRARARPPGRTAPAPVEPPRPVSLPSVSAALAVDASTAIARLRDLALLTGTPDALLPLPAVVDALGPYPAGLGPGIRAAASTTPGAAPPRTSEELDVALRDAPDSARRVVAALTWGPPVGTVDPRHPGPGTAWLLERSLLARLSPTQVVLPREVALAARRGRTHRDARTTARVPDAPTRAAEAVAAESARAAEGVARQVAALLTLWDGEPPAVLRAGGIGSRDLRKAGAALALDVVDAAFVIELAGMAGLIGPCSGADEAAWTPTVAADAWLEAGTSTRWALLVRAWHDSPRAPWLVGTRNERGDLRSALSRGLERPWVRVLRRAVLAALGTWPEGAAPSQDQVQDLLLWRAPRAQPPAEATQAVLREADLLGLTGAGALSASGRALLDGPHHGAPGVLGRGAVDAVAAALEADLPPLVDEIVVQGDLTAIVPGRPEPALERLLETVADVESRGAALAVRFTAASMRRALDRGLRPDHLLESLRAHSRVPLPQALEYLVIDVARRHGSIRIGAASSYLTSSDVAVVAELAADLRLTPLHLRAIAPTVLVSSEPAARVLEMLRAHDLSGVVEGPDGSVVSVGPGPRRAGDPSRSPRGRPGASREPADRHEPAASPAPAALASLVAHLRTGDAWAAAAAAAGGTASTPAHVVEVLRDAAAAGREVDVEVAGPTGSLERRRVRPLSVDVGRLRALDLARESELTIAVHRIAGVVVATPAH